MVSSHIGNIQRMFHWKFMKSLRNYRPGELIVMAEDADEARRKATDKIDDIFFSTYEWLKWNMDDYGREMLETFRRQFEEDLRAAPDETDGLVAVWGSE